MSHVGSFDMGMQLSESSIQRLIRGQHATGTMLHRGIRYARLWRFDYVVNAPDVQLVLAPSDLLAELRLRIIVQRRPANNAFVAGETCVLDVSLPMRIEVGEGDDPEPLESTTRIYLDFSSLQDSDVTLHPANEVAVAARDVLKNVLQEQSPKSIRLPALNIDGQAVRSLSARVMQFGGARYLSTGFNVRSSSRGDRGDLAVGYANRDWATALSPSYFLTRLRTALASRLPLPYRISRRCTVSAPWPLSGCWNWQIVRLTSLTVDLVSSAIHVHGTVHVRNTGALIPDLNFSFDADVTLSINSQGDIAASVGAVSVDLNDWYADIVNFLSGGAFINTISAAIQDAMRSNVSGGFSGIVTPSQLLALVSLGAPSSLDIDLVPRTISVSTQGVAVQGDLLVEPQNLPPEAAFRVLPFDSRHFVFNAVESTAPGGTIHQYRWKHADGSTEVFSNTSVRFVTEKTFGRMRGIQIEDTCLTVVDDRGRTAQTCIPPLRLPQPREDSLLLLGISRRATTGSAGDALLLLTPNANNPVRD